MFTNDQFAQTEYAFRARSAKVKPQPGKPNLPYRFIKIKFGRKAWIGKAYWFDVDQCDSWQYVDGGFGAETAANDVIRYAEYSNHHENTLSDAIRDLKRILDPCPTCACGRVANFEEVGHDQRGKSITVRHECPECGL